MNTNNIKIEYLSIDFANILNSHYIHTYHIQTLMIVGGISYHQNLGESEKLSQGTFISCYVKMIE